MYRSSSLVADTELCAQNLSQSSIIVYHFYRVHESLVCVLEVTSRIGCELVTERLSIRNDD